MVLRYINKIYYNYLKCGKNTLYITGRKKKNMNNNMDSVIINIRNSKPLSGPIAINILLING
jgi:hypothetical protein